jgi:DNA-binding transcriptional LysR family regulator
MEMIQIRHFVRIAETGSYIKAADLLDTGQSTLSRQVRALEVELRASLFYRHGRGVLLTEAGKKFLEYARGVLHLDGRRRDCRARLGIGFFRPAGHRHGAQHWTCLHPGIAAAVDAAIPTR